MFSCRIILPVPSRPDKSAALLADRNFAGQPEVPGRGPCADRSGGGFSIIELALSLGIVSFAFVSLLALLPAGMSTFRKAIDVSVGSQISQRVVNEAQQSDFNSFLAAAPALRYFDDQGQELPGQAGAIYQVNVRILPALELPGAAVGNDNLATVTVQIANNPGNRPLAMDAGKLWVPTDGVPLTTYSTVLAGNSLAPTL